MTKLDKKVELIKRQQAEIDRRNEVEEQATKLICEGRYTEATELLETLDDNVLKELQAEFEAIEETKEENIEQKLSENLKEVLKKQIELLSGLQEDTCDIHDVIALSQGIVEAAKLLMYPLYYQEVVRALR